MSQDFCTLTVWFEDPFWVGLIERQGTEGYQVCKVTFGAEPRDNEVYEWLLSRWETLDFSPFLSENAPKSLKMNPKRARREAQKSLSGPPKGTKAQEALKLQRREIKSAKHERHQDLQRRSEEERFQLRQEKKRQKKKGH